MIEIKHLTKRFGNVAAVENLSLTVQQGETFALLGPNGSGKSTTLRCLVGLMAPTEGEILINGFNIARNPRQAKSLLSYLPQRMNFPDTLTAREILEFYARLRKVLPERINELLGASKFDFDGFADKIIGEFSGGMAQRLGLAVACLPDAPVLVLDEPTVGLDPDGAVRFRKFLADLKEEGKTIIFSSHVLHDVEQLADRIAVLVGGRVVALESIETLRKGLIRHSRMRVAMASPDCRWAELAVDAGAQAASLEGELLVITSVPENRFAILKSIEGAGGQIEGFATEELSLEDILLEYLRNSGEKQESGQ